MLKQVIKREMFLRNLLSFLGLALAAIIMMTLILTQTVERSRRERYDSSLQERMQLALDDIELQFKQAQKIALEAGNKYECNRKIFSQQKFYEVELLEALAGFDGRLGFKSDYFLLYFEQIDKLYYMRSQLCAYSTFTKVYFDKLGEKYPDILLDEMMQLTKAAFLPLHSDRSDPYILMVYPFMSTGNYTDRAVIGWTLKESQIAERLKLVTGGIGESFALYYNDVCLINSGITEEGNTYCAALEKNGFRLVVDKRMDSLYNMNTGIDRINRVLYLVSFGVLVVLALSLTIYNYRPIQNLMLKYRRADKNELDGLEAIIEEAYTQIRTLDVNYSQQLSDTREHVLLLLLNGVCNERVLASTSIFADELKGPLYAVVTIQIDAAPNEIERQVHELFDNIVSANVCSWKAGIYHVVFSMHDADIMDSVINIFRDVLFETGKEYKLGASDICNDIVMLSAAYKQALERIENNDALSVQPLTPALGGAEEDVRMQNVLAYIDRHISDWELTLASTAAEFKLSTAYFSNLFKQANGENFHHYVTTLRIKEAKRLLTETALSIAQVGQSVGFVNLSHFIKVFKEEEECTPGNYRQFHQPKETQARE